MKTLILICAAMMLTGCVSSKHYRGLLPDKDARFRGISLIVATPWGTQTLKIDEIDTRLNSSTNELAPIPQP